MASITLYLMGEKGKRALLKVLPYKSIIDIVVGSRDAAVQNDYYEDIRLICAENSIKWVDKREFSGTTSEYSLAIAWRWMLPTDNKLIIMHDSLLPKYRGFAPLVNMLINKEPEIGVTAIYANGEFDRGDVIMQQSVPVSYPIKIHDAIEKVSLIFEALIERIFETISNGKELLSVPQIENEATYSLWRNEDDYAIDWNRDSSYIQQFVYSVGFPYRGASTIIDGIKHRVFDCEIINDVRIENRCPGKVLFMRDGCPVVVCGKGLLKITELETEEKVSCLPMKKFRLWFK